jgi:hypothetical protein
MKRSSSSSSRGSSIPPKTYKNKTRSKNKKK